MSCKCVMGGYELWMRKNAFIVNKMYLVVYRIR